MPPVHAWSSARVSNHRSNSTPTPEVPVLTGRQAVNISVGCGSSITYPVDEAIDPTRPRFSYVIESPVAEFISLHFSTFNLPPNDYVVIRPTEDSERPPVKYTGKTHRSRFFSKALHTKSVTLELFTNGSAEAVDATACVGFSIEQYRFLAAPAAFTESSPEVICGADDSDEATCFQAYPEAYAKSNAVARLLIHKHKKSYFCTGWLVGCEGHLLTNHHCVSEPAHAENMEVEFMGQGNACAVKCGRAFGCRGKTRAATAKLVFANPKLDYALIKLDGNLTESYGYLQMRESGATKNERIYIPQHPAGWGKRIAMKDGEQWGKVVSLTRGGCLPKQVSYSLDTQGGSSGSPVLAWKDNTVVALHHCGGCPNTAVNTNKIVADLRERDLLPKCAVHEPPDTTATVNDDDANDTATNDDDGNNTPTDGDATDP